MATIDRKTSGVYMVHEREQIPADGVAVWYFRDFDHWVCEDCGAMKYRAPLCRHIALAMKRRRGDDAG